MHPVIRRLVREHGVMLTTIGAIEREVAVAEAGGPFDTEVVVQALQYLHDFPEWFHHPLEEALFARAIGRDPGCEGAFAEVWAEHDRFPTVSRRLLDALTDGPAPPSMTPDELLRELSRYIAQQRRHIERENEEIFLVLLSVLTDEDWELGESGADPTASDAVSEAASAVPAGPASPAVDG